LKGIKKAISLTCRADSVVRMARIGLAALLSLIAAAWAMGFLLRRFALREESFRKEMARGEHLAKLGQMGAVIAHEIRNPLAGIKGYAQLLHEKAGPA
jgi:two-component system sensor histidine kinase HydH